MKQVVDLNADLGEGFGPWRIGDGIDEALFPLITSANIATGFHAGDPTIMRRMVQLARTHGVGVGAHPGLRDLVGFGRREINAGVDELVNDVLYQLGALRELACLAQVGLQHVKPHGALYMRAARDEALSQALVGALRIVAPTLYLFCMPGSATYRVARAMGHPVVREFYADREYDATGSIVFRRNPAPLDAAAVAARVLRACAEGCVRTVDGEDIAIEFDSICIHSDTPGALALVTETRSTLQRHGIRLAGIADLALS